MFGSTRKTDIRENKKIIHINYDLTPHTLGLNAEWIHIPLTDPIYIHHQSEVFLPQFWLNTSGYSTPAFILSIEQFPSWDSNNLTSKCGITIPSNNTLTHYDNFFLFYTNPVRLDKISIKLGDIYGNNIPSASNLLMTLLFVAKYQPQ
jgi:hypothetical protein